VEGLLDQHGKAIPAPKIPVNPPPPPPPIQPALQNAQGPTTPAEWAECCELPDLAELMVWILQQAESQGEPVLQVAGCSRVLLGVLGRGARNLSNILLACGEPTILGIPDDHGNDHFAEPEFNGFFVGPSERSLMIRLMRKAHGQAAVPAPAPAGAYSDMNEAASAFREVAQQMKERNENTHQRLDED